MEIYSEKHLLKIEKAINELVDLVGGNDESLSNIFMINSSNISHWRYGRQKVPIKHLRKIRLLFRKKGFDEGRLRPDIYS